MIFSIHITYFSSKMLHKMDVLKICHKYLVFNMLAVRNEWQKSVCDLNFGKLLLFY